MRAKVIIAIKSISLQKGVYELMEPFSKKTPGFANL